MFFVFQLQLQHCHLFAFFIFRRSFASSNCFRWIICLRVRLVQGMHEDALKAYESLVSRLPTRALVQMDCAACHWKAANYWEAMLHWQNAVSHTHQNISHLIV